MYAVLMAFFSCLAYSQSKAAWTAPAAAANMTNPVANTNENVTEGKKIYIGTCSPCHGTKGKGDGAAAIACNPPPADHTSQNVQRESDGALFWKITTGHGQMISYKNVLKDDQRWKVVLYIRTLKCTK